MTIKRILTASVGLGLVTLLTAACSTLRDASVGPGAGEAIGAGTGKGPAMDRIKARAGGRRRGRYKTRPETEQPR